MFLVHKAWIDPYENHSSNAAGYSVEGYVESADEVDFTIPGPTCWATGKDFYPLYKVTEISKFKKE